MVTTSNYYAEIDADSCIACEACLDRCNVHAISMENDVAVVNRQKCLGCGLCASVCPAESITMASKLPAEASPIFTRDTELMQAMAQESGKKFPFD